MSLHGYLVADKYVVIAESSTAALLYADGQYQIGFDDVTIREVPSDFSIWSEPGCECECPRCNFTVGEAISTESRPPVSFRLQHPKDPHATPY